MPFASRRHVTPRKTPRQTRSTMTLDAIFEATIQVLLAEGLNRLTTTRVAERAGVSVGTLYQYFPNKQALLYALNDRYLNMVAGKVVEACARHHGAPTAQMVEALVTAYWEAKTERSDVSRALYRSAVEIDNSVLTEAFAERVDKATLTMFASAPDATYADLAVVNTTLLSVIVGTVRNVFARNLPPSLETGVREQLIAMCLSYLATGRESRDSDPR